MEKHIHTLLKAVDILEFAITKGWSESDLISAINLIHSQTKDIDYSPSLDLTTFSEPFTTCKK
ncbi:hypothetical protein [Macrococcoides caseolyticum]|uniref:hypothetical protein n=1 Tax=Macrococcoides caseolyticum TaxID=69966 RepID=UPI0018E1BB71|nr:hypothetical protein [Macrococcus caseolyticus]QQB06183.1 hypothetical protein I6H62_03180 [Macrococcus caseolyticus]